MTAPEYPELPDGHGPEVPDIPPGAPGRPPAGRPPAGRPPATRPSSPLARALAGDRPLAAATAALLLLAWSPLLATPFLPLQDLPAHVGMASALGPAARGLGEAGERYAVSWAPLPYWGGVVALAAAVAALGPLWGAKAVVALAVALLPLATMRLLLALGRSPRAGLWAFALCWDHSLYFGWLSFSLAMAASLWLLAWVIEAEGPRAQARLALAGVALGLTHVLASGYLVLQSVGQVAAGREGWRRRLGGASAAAGVALALGPWAWGIVSGRGGPRRAWEVEWQGAGDKIAGLFRATLDTLPHTRGWTGGGCVLLLLLSPALLGLLPARPAGPGDRRALALAGLGLALYLALPLNVMSPVDHYGTGSRFATAAVLGWLLVPRPRLEGRHALALAPGVLVVAAHLLAVRAQFRAFGDEVAPLARVLAAAPPCRRLLPLVFEQGRPMQRDHRPMNQLHAYLAARQGSFDPYYFDAPGLHPLRYRPEGRPPAPPWFAPAQFSLERHGRFYDQVLVQGLGRDPLAGEPRAHRVIEAGIWRLYTIEPDARP